MRIPRVCDRRGAAAFTLLETVVTLGLIAVLAAFTIPTVIQNADAGDPVKVQHDLNTVRAAIESFATDGHSGFPHQLSALVNRPVVGTSRLVDSSAMTPNQAAAWRGPYLGSLIGMRSGDSLPTGYAAFMMNFVDRYDIVANVPEHSRQGTLSTGFGTTNALFAAVELHGLTAAQAKRVNALIDGAGDTDRPDGTNSTGRFRFVPLAEGKVIAYYLAAPIQQ
jgi:type II secretory pathway pseudopilin PulG